MSGRRRNPFCYSLFDLLKVFLRKGMAWLQQQSFFKYFGWPVQICPDFSL